MENIKKLFEEFDYDSLKKEFRNLNKKAKKELFNKEELFFKSKLKESLQDAELYITRFKYISLILSLIEIDLKIPKEFDFKDFLDEDLIELILKNDFIGLLYLLSVEEISPNISYYNYNISPLIVACKNNKIEAVKLLLKYNANPNYQDKNTNTPLLVAAENDSINIVRLLLEYKADVSIKDSEDHDALYYAEINKNKKIAELLKNQNIKDKSTNKLNKNS